MKWNFLILLLLVFTLPGVGQQKEDLDTSAYQLLNLPNLAGENFSGQIVIAVIDDGFLLNHKELKDYYWQNKAEIPNNNIDDDENGYIDDVFGWDAADADANVEPGKEVIKDYYHGTMIASIIAMVAKRSLGSDANKNIKIMPIKALSDYATRNTLEDGYIGIDYAIANKADVICMAWSGGSISPEFAAKIAKANNQGILLLASAGNQSTNILTPPADLESVYCIAAIDNQYKKIALSNYNEKVDLVGFGEDVKAAHSAASNAYFNAGGTSSAVALVTGCVAVLKTSNPKSTQTEIMQALKNTALPIDYLNMRYLARLGAGLPDVSAAYQYLNNEQSRVAVYNPNRTKGNLILQLTDTQLAKDVQLPKGIKEVTLSLNRAQKLPRNSTITFMVDDKVISQTLLSDIEPFVRIPSNSFKVEVTDYKSKAPLEFSYSSIPFDSVNMYCSGENYFQGDSGTVVDGSGQENYCNNISCKWIITVAEGKNIKLDFTSFDTEANMDNVLIFQGEHALQENALASFSGEKLPPVLVVGQNKLLIWFTTNNSKTNNGWALRYSATNQEPGVYLRPE